MAEDKIIEKLEANIKERYAKRDKYKLFESKDCRLKVHHEVRMINALHKEVRGIEIDIFLDMFYLPDITWNLSYTKSGSILYPNDTNAVQYQAWEEWLYGNVPNQSIRCCCFQLDETTLVTAKNTFKIIFESGPFNNAPKLPSHERMTAYILENNLKLDRDSLNGFNTTMCTIGYHMNTLPKELIV